MVRSPASLRVRRMLTILALAGWVVLAGLGVGLAVERLWLRDEPSGATALTGIIALTAAASWLSLLFPLGPWNAVLCSSLGLAGLAWRRGTLRVPLSMPLLLGSLAVCWLAAGPPQVYDTGFYHAQAVRWINEYPAVPGLANLQGQLGFNSAWFVWAAVWDHGPLDGKSYHVVNAAFWVAGWALCLQALGRLRGELKAADLVQAAVLFPLCRFEHYAASLSPELPAHVLLIYAFSLLLRLPDEAALKRLMLVAAFLPALKLSLAPALLLIPAGLWLTRSKPRETALAAGTLAVVTGAFVVRSVVLTGYPVFPFEPLDLFSPDWKVPAASVEMLRLEVQGWAIEPWAGPAAALQPLGEWSGRWLRRNLAEHPVEIALLPLALIGWVGVAAARRKGLLPSSLALIGVAFWFVSAPDVRFGFGWIVLAAIVPAALLLEGRPAPTWAPTAGRWMAAAWVVGVAIRWSPSGPPPITTLQPLPTAEMRERRLPGGLRVSVPLQGDRAWDAPLPNTPLPDPGLRLRGAGLRHGFRQEESGAREPTER